jgi:hypothetical protein
MRHVAARSNPIGDDRIGTWLAQPGMPKGGTPMHRKSALFMLAPLVIPLTVLGCSKVAETATGPTAAPSLTVDYTGSTSRALANTRPEPVEIPTEAREAPPVREMREPSTPLEHAVREESHYIEEADMQALDLERIAADRDREEEAREAERRAELRAHPVVY